MKRRNIFLLLSLSVLWLLCGCQGNDQGQEENGYTVYYKNAEGTKLVESKYDPSAQTFDDMMEELERQLETPAGNSVSVLPDQVKMNGYERGIDALRIDFSKEYYDLNNIDEVLLRAAIVKTFSQIPGVTKVMITVEQEQLVDAEGKAVPAMDANSFIDTKEGGINSYQYAKLTLFFTDAGGKELVTETRNLHYSSNMVLERVVIEQLIQGPDSKELYPVLGSDVKIQNIYIKNGICTINLDEAANRIPTENNVDPETTLYAMVNSICATCDGITGVKFEISGDGTGTFRGKVDLNQVFESNQSYVEEEELASELMTVTEASMTETEVQSELDTHTGNSDIGVDPSLTNDGNQTEGTTE